LFEAQTRCIVIHWLLPHTHTQGTILLIELQIRPFRALDEWFTSALGQSIGRDFSNEISQQAELLRGETLVQLGNCGTNPWLSQFNYAKKWIVSPYPIESGIAVEGSLNQLPFDRNSLDCLVAPLTLEPFGTRLSLLDEIDRVLSPMGLLVGMSLNPWSAWGIAMKLGLLPCYGGHKVKMRTALTMNRTWIQRGYKQLSLSYFCYRLPINNEVVLKKMAFFDEVGKMLWPIPSGFYCFIVQKCEFIHPSLSLKPKLSSIAAPFKTPFQPAIN
jgi:hypothetical protein